MPTSSHARTSAHTSNLMVGPLILKRFVVFLLLLTVTSLGISLPVYLQYKKGLQDQLLAQEEISVASAVQMFKKEMYEQLHILDLIVESHILKEYLADGTLEQQKRLERILNNISTSFHRFDQIRLLDNSGQETIRVNYIDGKAQLIAQENLQNKADRYYFKATQKMPFGQFYVSTLDLNIEQEVIEVPHKPTLRFATALQDPQGHRAGALVMNYLAEGMLTRFRQLMSQRIDQQGVLLDNRGYWLSHHERDHEWGADLGHLNHNFSQFYPEVWPIISANESGVLKTPDGVFRYQNIEPLNFIDSQPAHFRIEHHPLMSEESYANTNWKLVVFIPRDVIDSHSFLSQPLGRTLLALFVLLIASLAYLAAYLVTHKQRRRQEEHYLRTILEQQANIDALTGLNNRRNFYVLGELELKRALRQETPLAALMLDADLFKKVNDTYGHAAGDLVLQDLAKTMKNTLRDIDVLGRIGGEEFAVLLPNTHLPQALEVAERLRLKLAERKITLPEGGSIGFTVSIGLALLTPTEQRLNDLLKKADLALYQAKEQGRNRVVHYTEKMPTSLAK